MIGGKSRPFMPLMGWLMQFDSKSGYFSDHFGQRGGDVEGKERRRDSFSPI